MVQHPPRPREFTHITSKPYCSDVAKGELAAEISQLSAETVVLYSKEYMTRSVLPAVSWVVHPPVHVVWNTSFLPSLPPQPFTPHTKHLAINVFCPQHSCYHNQGLVCTVDSVLCHGMKLLSAHCSELSGCSWYFWCVCTVLANTAQFLEPEKALFARGEVCSSTVCYF